MERDLLLFTAEVTIKYFNSHAHVERDPFADKDITELLNFNSHAHVERDKFERGPLSGSEISTHTLTWSVTMRFEETAAETNISTHTLTWSVTNSG